MLKTVEISKVPKVGVVPEVKVTPKVGEVSRTQKSQEWKKFDQKLNVPEQEEQHSNPSHVHAATRLVKMSNQIIVFTDWRFCNDAWPPSCISISSSDPLLSIDSA